MKHTKKNGQEMAGGVSTKQEALGEELGIHNPPKASVCRWNPWVGHGKRVRKLKVST
jgi:hypothetical protein